MITDSNSGMLSVWAGQRRYAVEPRQADHLGLLDTAGELIDQRGRPLICRELGALLGEAREVGPGRRHAITVALRRRNVVFLVDYIDSLGGAGSLETHPL
jgi:hypothetical protein